MKRSHCKLASYLVAAVVWSLPAVADEAACPGIASRYAEQGHSPEARIVNSFLIEAAASGCQALVRQLLAAGGSIKARGRNGDSVLHHAARSGNDDIAALLIERGAVVDLRDLEGGTPLFHAVEADRAKTARLLLQRGADPDTEGRSGVTPLEAATFNGNEGIVELLLEWNADSRHVDRTGKSALVYAAARGFTGIAGRLLATGIDVNARYGNNLTALMWAAGHSNDVPPQEGAAMVSMLLDKGAQRDDQDDRGRTALMIAAELGHRHVVELLVARGADTALRDRDGKSARDLAVSEDIRLALGR